MSIPNQPDPVKRIASLFSPDSECLNQAIAACSREFGEVDWMSPPLFFDQTRYYAREMGWPLHRRFISFRDLVSPEVLVGAKLLTNEMEKRMAGTEGKRRVNMDPGYVAAERLVLASGKNFTHRIYLHRGIYADLTLIYQKGEFIPLPWTYPDYADPRTRSLFKEVRRRYMTQLRESRSERKVP